MISFEEFLGRLLADETAMKAMTDAYGPRSFFSAADGTKSPTMETRVTELAKYLYLRAKHPDKRWPMPRGAGLDRCWHALIVQTESYARVCGWLGTFVHHRSGQFAEDDAWYDGFVAAYQEEFAEPIWTIWPFPGKPQRGEHECA